MTEDWVDDLPHEAPGLAAMAEARMLYKPGEDEPIGYFPRRPQTTTPPLLATRDALAEGLHRLGSCKRCQWAHENQWPCGSAERFRGQADALLASGVVRDPATLADDEEWKP